MEFSSNFFLIISRYYYNESTEKQNESTLEFSISHFVLWEEVGNKSHSKIHFEALPVKAIAIPSQRHPLYFLASPLSLSSI